MVEELDILTEIRITPPENLLQILEILFRNFESKNANGISILQDKYKAKEAEYSNHISKAINELEPLMFDLKNELDSKSIERHKLDRYEKIKNGEINSLSKALPIILYESIRDSIEDNMGFINKSKYKKILKYNRSKRIYYVDEVSFMKIYPAYGEFLDYEGTIVKYIEISPEAAYMNLKGYSHKFKALESEEIELYLKPLIIKDLQILITSLEKSILKPSTNIGLIQRGSISLDMNNGFLSIDNNKWNINNKNNKPIKFLEILMKFEKGVSYLEINKHVDFGNSSDEYYDELDAGSIHILKRNLLRYLISKSVGMPKKVAKNLVDKIINIQKQGYKFIE